MKRPIRRKQAIYPFVTGGVKPYFRFFLNTNKQINKEWGLLSDEIGPLSKLSFLFFQQSIRMSGVDCRSNQAVRPHFGWVRLTQNSILSIPCIVTVCNVHMESFSAVFSSSNLNYIPNASSFFPLLNGMQEYNKNQYCLCFLQMTLITRMYSMMAPVTKSPSHCAVKAAIHFELYVIRQPFRSSTKAYYCTKLNLQERHSIQTCDVCDRQKLPFLT